MECGFYQPYIQSSWSRTTYFLPTIYLVTTYLESNCFHTTFCLESDRHKPTRYQPTILPDVWLLPTLLLWPGVWPLAASLLAGLKVNKVTLPLHRLPPNSKDWSGYFCFKDIYYNRAEDTRQKTIFIILYYSIKAPLIIMNIIHL